MTAIAAAALTGCAARAPEAAIPKAVPAPGVIWRIEDGDVIKTKVFSQPDLGTEAMVNGNGTAFFPAIGRVAVVGLTLDSLETFLNTRYSTQVVRNAAVQVSMTREITLYGFVRAPGVYASDPGVTILGLIAKAGGQASASLSNNPMIYLELADGRRLQLPREARLGSLDLHRRDAVFLDEPSFFVRNSTAIFATSVIVNLIGALISITSR
jgi:protein involved in polysaccharide export with SLBB domain